MGNIRTNYTVESKYWTTLITAVSTSTEWMPNFQEALISCIILTFETEISSILCIYLWWCSWAERGSVTIRDNKKAAWMLMALSPFLTQHRLLFPLPRASSSSWEVSPSDSWSITPLPQPAASWEAEISPIPGAHSIDKEFQVHFPDWHNTVDHHAPECLSLKWLSEVGPPKDTTKLSPPWAVFLLSESRVWEKAFGKG